MALTLSSLSDLARAGFDDIIDVRAPAEYAEDHLPGAISLPVLDDAERAEIGTLYKQVNPFTARKRGAALVARNAAAHLMGPLEHKPGGWRPLVYCWRGGQRSGSFATILSQIGWRVETVSGGYKAWRGLVVRALYDTVFPCPVLVLDGNTGSAKTEVLNLLPARGVQVIDLEGLARHRGSLFGGTGPQPAQKAFETALALAIDALDPCRPVVIEAESSKVGECRLPPELWKAMCTAHRMILSAPRAARAQYLVRAYGDLVEDGALLAQRVGQLRHSHARTQIDTWQDLAASGAYAQLAEDLMARHYDPRYEKHRGRMDQRSEVLETAELVPRALSILADRIAERVHATPHAQRDQPPGSGRTG